METVTLEISGMSCGACVAHVRKALSAMAGVQVTSLEIGRAEVDFDPTLQTPATLAAALQAAGYPAEVG